MKGGPSIEILIDLALGDNKENSRQAVDILKGQVFLYEADMNRLEKAYLDKNVAAKEILTSYLNAQFLQIFLLLKKKLKS